MTSNQVSFSQGNRMHAEQVVVLQESGALRSAVTEYGVNQPGLYMKHSLGGFSRVGTACATAC